MSRRTADLFLVNDLDDRERTSELTEDDLCALRAVAEWIKTFVVKPHRDLGRAGPVTHHAAIGANPNLAAGFVSL